MPLVLTMAASISCAHGGKATLSSGAKLKVQNNPVLREADTPGWTIALCGQTNADKGQKPCTKVLSAKESSSKLKVGGSPVLLQSFAGKTDGVPENSAGASSAGQTKLSAV